MSDSVELSPPSTAREGTPADTPACPVGESRCAVIEEVMALRGEVSRLSRQARTDTLTGLSNYRYLLQVLDQEMERTRRSQQPTALVMVDLDHFKRINDRWGHETGNRALVETARVLRAGIRRLDIPCRYGGEEFAVVLPATDMLTAIQVAERLRAGIAGQPVSAGERHITLSASLGVEVYHAFQDDTPEGFIARADRCMYRAKQAGRDRVCHGSTGEERPAAAVSREEREMLVDLFSSPEES